MSEPAEPTAEQCNTNAALPDVDGMKCFACWYPQMGGYCGKAVVMFHPSNELGGCFEAYVWHDGSFPFGDDQNPVHIHHCSGFQFIDFGKTVLDKQGAAKGG